MALYVDKGDVLAVARTLPEEEKCCFLSLSGADSGAAAVQAAGSAGGAVKQVVDSGAVAVQATAHAEDAGGDVDTVRILSPCLDSECETNQDKVT